MYYKKLKSGTVAGRCFVSELKDGVKILITEDFILLNRRYLKVGWRAEGRVSPGERTAAWSEAHTGIVKY